MATHRRSVKTITWKRRNGGARARRRKLTRHSRYSRTQRTEDKFFDTAVTVSSVATAGEIGEDSLLTISQGVGESQRVGRAVTLTHIHGRIRVELPISTVSSSTHDTLRVILYLDEQTNGATATVGNLLEVADYQSFENLANSARFKILHDKVTTINALTGGGNGTTEDYGAVSKNYEFNLRCSIPIVWDNTTNTGVISTMRVNNIGLLLISEAALVNFESNWRVRFEDK